MRDFDFMERKTLHVTIEKNIFQGMRDELSTRGLSAQEVFEELAGRISSSDEYIVTILRELVRKKRSKQKRVAGLTPDEIYEILEKEGSFSSEDAQSSEVHDVEK